MSRILCPQCNFAYPGHSRQCPVGSIAKKKRAQEVRELAELDELPKVPTPRPSVKTRMRLNLPKDLSLAIFCVIGQGLAGNLKQWKVHLFVLEDGEVISFP